MAEVYAGRCQWRHASPRLLEPIDGWIYGQLAVPVALGVDLLYAAATCQVPTTTREIRLHLPSTRNK
jgi:hypothetical protein